MSSLPREKSGSSELDDAMRSVRRTLWAVGIFSCVVNILMLTSPLYMLQVYDRVLTSGRVETLVLLTALAFAALAILALLDNLRMAVLRRASNWLGGRLGPVLIERGVQARVEGASQGAARQGPNDLGVIRNFMNGQGIPAFFDVPWTPIFLVVIYILHPLLGVIATSAAALILVLMLLNHWSTAAKSEDARAAEMSASKVSDSAFANAEAVSAMGMQGAMMRRWRKSFDETARASLASGARGGMFLSLIKFLRFAVQVAILGGGAWLVLQGEIGAGSMIAGSILLGRALQPIEQVVGAWRSFGNARAAHGRLRERFAAHPPRPKGIVLPEPTGLLRVRGLHVGATPSAPPVVHDVSFALQPGETLAIIGPSGSGKTTLARALVGLAQPRAGEIRLDEARLEQWDRGQLGQAIGYLPQAVELFAGTVRENIARMGDVEDEAVIKAATLARAHQTILGLREGYDTVIGDGGVGLSSGQRQRVGLARALYDEPKLIVLDEPNANLDQTGESALTATLKALKGQRITAVVVGHRPSTVMAADRVMVLQNGRVTAFGPRDKVMEEMRRRAGEEREKAARRAAAAQPRPGEQAVSPSKSGPEAAQGDLAAKPTRSAARWMTDAARKSASGLVGVLDRARGAPSDKGKDER